jgi:fatty acid desaturase
MAAAARVKPKDFFTDTEWAALAARSSWRGVWLVAHCWGVILLAGAAGVLWPPLIPLAVMIIGARQLGLAILMHEAAHGGLHPNLKLNDALGHWLCAVPVGASLPAYRPYHLSHHKYAQQAEDPDLPLSAPFPVSSASLRRKMVRDLTGQTFFKQRIAPALPFLAVNAAGLLALSAAGVWWAYFVLWLLPMATWFPLVTRLRNIAEHAVTPDPADPLRHARTTRASLVERALIAPYWVNHHCEHHMFMHLPCYRLPAAHRLLERKGVTPRMEVQPGYLTVLKAASAA